MATVMPSAGQQALAGLKEGLSIDELLASGVSRATIEQARIVLRRATPEVIAFAERGEVPTNVVADAVRGRTKPEQAGWTPADVLRVGKEARLSRPSQKGGYNRKKKKHRPAPPPPPVPENLPLPVLKFPTAAETGFPVDGTLAEQDAHHKKYGRTPLHAQETHQMLASEARVNAYMAAIIAATNASQPGPGAFFEALDALLADDKYAGRARRQLTLLRERLPLLIERALSLACHLEGREKKPDG